MAAGAAKQSNRIFVAVESLYGRKQAIAAGIKRIVKPKGARHIIR